MESAALYAMTVRAFQINPTGAGAALGSNTSTPYGCGCLRLARGNCVGWRRAAIPPLTRTREPVVVDVAALAHQSRQAPSIALIGVQLFTLARGHARPCGSSPLTFSLPPSRAGPPPRPLKREQRLRHAAMAHYSRSSEDLTRNKMNTLHPYVLHGPRLTDNFEREMTNEMAYQLGSDAPSMWWPLLQQLGQVVARAMPASSHRSHSKLRGEAP
jgi:hypothetical protein